MYWSSVDIESIAKLTRYLIFAIWIVVFNRCRQNELRSDTEVSSAVNLTTAVSIQAPDRWWRLRNAWMLCRPNAFEDLGAARRMSTLSRPMICCNISTETVSGQLQGGAELTLLHTHLTGLKINGSGSPNRTLKYPLKISRSWSPPKDSSPVAGSTSSSSSPFPVTLRNWAWFGSSLLSFCNWTTLSDEEGTTSKGA